MRPSHRSAASQLQRRGFLAHLAALALTLSAMPLATATHRDPRRSVREADFYRPHDLAG